MKNQSNQPDQRPPMPTLYGDSAKTQSKQATIARPVQPTPQRQLTNRSDGLNKAFNLPTQPVKPVIPKLPAQSKANPAALHKASRHAVRVALATGTTIAALLGTQALAIFGHTADANPVIVGATADTGSGTDLTQVADAPTDVPTDPPIATNTAQSSPTNTATATATLTKTAIPSKTALKVNTPHPTTIKYTVVSTDTLGAIAIKFSTTTNMLMTMNTATLRNGSMLQVGQVLLVPGPLSTDPLSPMPSPTVTATPSLTLTPSVTTAATNSATPKPTSTPKPIATAKPYVAPVVQPAPVTRSSRR